MAAHGLTWLQIINRVLARLREDSVAANNTTTYSTFIGALVNQVKAEIEQAFPWHAMRDTSTVNTVDGETTYILTDFGEAQILTAWNTTSMSELRQSTNKDFDRKFFGVSAVARGAPSQYITAGLDDSYDRRIDIWPAPDGVYVLKFNCFKPQDDLAADGDIPLVPQSLLIEETIARAQRERGEEGEQQPLAPGQTFILTELLAQEVAREAGHDPSEMDWEPE